MSKLSYNIPMISKVLTTACCLFTLAHPITQAQTRSYVQEEIIKVAGVTTEAQIDALVASGKQTSRVYFDGMGRPIQTIGVQASPQLKDLILPVQYDVLGRQTKSYLPYVAAANDGQYRPNAINSEQGAYYQNGTTDKVDDNAAPFSQQVFENSPLQRLLKQGSIGTGYQPVSGEHYKTVSYRSNTSADNVLVWSNDGVTAPTTYAANALTVIDATDEQGIETLSFTDTYGRNLLKRQVKGTEWLDTYYIYNIAGVVSYVVPPKAVNLMQTNANYSLTQSGVNRLIFKYAYDDRGRIVEKTLPSTEKICMVYDPLNRPVLIQDGRMRGGHTWNYIKYDGKGRAISQGIYTDNTHITRTDMQQFVNGLNYATNWVEQRNNDSGNGYYTNTVFPTSSTEPLAYSYYDDYDLNDDGSDDYNYVDQSLSGETGASSKTRGMPTMIRKRTIGQGLANIWLTSVNFYDLRGQIIQTLSNNQFNALMVDTKTIVPNFIGKPVVQKVVKAAAATTTVQTNYTYDAGERLTAIDQSYNGAAPVRIGAYEYNELGQLVKKNVHLLAASAVVPANITLGSTDAVGTGDQKTVVASNSITLSPNFYAAQGSTFAAFIGSSAYLQGIDYRYNVRGQLTSINNSTLTADGVKNDDANDVFGIEMLYDQQPVGLSNIAYFNGQLSAVRWMSRNSDGSTTNERSYRYNYDQLNRLTAAFYQERSGGTWNSSGAFDEKDISYDAAGNILGLKRNAFTGSAIAEIDNLQYTYDIADPNRLKIVTDGNGSNYTGFGFKNLTGSTSNYTYDDNGNMLIDPYKGISTTYNHLNRADVITITTGVGKYINYTYDAGGTLLRKMQYNNSTLQKTTDYTDGFVYENGTLAYFGTPEGRVRNAAGLLKPEYMIADQQGNVRVSFENNNGTAKVVQENSYYAFGLVMPGGSVNTPATSNKNLYNAGSELQNDLDNNLPDLYQTFYRNYDAALGRFTGIDPMTEALADLTGYNYAANNPIMFNDPLGDKYVRAREDNGNDGVGNYLVGAFQSLMFEDPLPSPFQSGGGGAGVSIYNTSQTSPLNLEQLSSFFNYIVTNPQNLFKNPYFNYTSDRLFVYSGSEVSGQGSKASDGVIFKRTGHYVDGGNNANQGGDNDIRFVIPTSPSVFNLKKIGNAYYTNVTFEQVFYDLRQPLDMRVLHFEIPSLKIMVSSKSRYGSQYLSIATIKAELATIFTYARQDVLNGWLDYEIGSPNEANKALVKSLNGMLNGWFTAGKASTSIPMPGAPKSNVVTMFP